jgi:hypothetical protein
MVYEGTVEVTAAEEAADIARYSNRDHRRRCCW